jgi:hypothetical protein
MTYNLCRLHLNGLIGRIEHTHPLLCRPQKAYAVH